MDNTLFWIIAGVAVLIGVILQRLSGMGTGLVVAPTLAALFGGAIGVLMSNMTAIVSSALILYAIRGRVAWRRGAVIVAWAIPGAVLGAVLVQVVPTAWLTIFVGVVVLIALALTFARPHVREIHSPLLTAAAGATGGFFNTASGQAAPALLMYARFTRWEQREFAATLQLIFLGMNILSVGFKSIGMTVASLPPVWVIPAVVVLVVVGVAIGSRLERRVSPAAARRLAVGLAVLGAGLAIVRGVLAL
ncbi:MAG: sulfite exporter TauE/SafE family protein [bacterium]|nr:sulfite exporter TauE/SafE family protein [bacterium]